MALKTGDVAVTSGMLLLIDPSDIFTKEEWTAVLISSQGSQDAPRAVLEALGRKVGRELTGKAQVLNIQTSGALPTFQDRQTLTVFLRGVGVREF